MLNFCRERELLTIGESAASDVHGCDSGCLLGQVALLNILLYILLLLILDSALGGLCWAFQKLVFCVVNL